MLNIRILDKSRFRKETIVQYIHLNKTMHLYSSYNPLDGRHQAFASAGGNKIQTDE